MDYDAHVDAAATEVGRLLEALDAGPLDEPVPTCPGWTMGDLLGHVAGVCAMWTHSLDGGDGFPDVWPEVPDDPGAAVEALAVLAAGLVDRLRAARPDQPAWTWVPDRQDARFVARRVAHELTVHRVDAQLARFGAALGIEPALAADGIDEAFVLLAARGRQPGGDGQTMHVHGTDGEGEWLVTFLADRVDVVREHAKGDLALRGALGDLELVLYGRPPIGDVQRFGDEAVLDLWRAAFS